MQAEWKIRDFELGAVLGSRPDLRDYGIGAQILADLGIIYFDFDKWNIRPDAALELDKVVTLMNKYPEMVIRLESHTDSRANDAYNIHELQPLCEPNH